jgi:16S rRNA G1207 methylase RsmC
VITLNDQTGIVSNSVVYKNKNTLCYRIVDHETIIGSISTKDGGRYAEIKRVNYDQFDPQDVDLIVYSYSKIQPENAFDAIEALKHVKEGGKMLVLTKSDEHAKAFSDDFLTWNLKHCECVAEGSIVHIQVNRQG